SHEVVHVTNPPRRKTLVNAIPCDGADARLRLEVYQAIAVFLLALDATHKISLWNVRAELGHHWETASDVALCFRMGNVGFHFQDTRATPNDRKLSDCRPCCRPTFSERLRRSRDALSRVQCRPCCRPTCEAGLRRCRVALSRGQSPERRGTCAVGGP